MEEMGLLGLVVSTIVILCLNLSIGLGPESVLGLISVGVLYGVLQIGKENKGWPQLH
jgi:hypothetical protein